MEPNSKNVTGRSKNSAVSILMFVAAAVVLLVGIAVLVSNIVVFRKTVEQYVAQGIPADLVTKELILPQLLPGIFQSFLYYGAALILFGIGILNNKVSKFLAMLSNTDVHNETADEHVIVQNTDKAEETEVSVDNEAAEVNEEVKND